jgi:DNA-binding GntR family transcriptional regulator
MSGSLDALDDHRPLGDLVYNRLRAAIIEGRLAPGQWLRQQALAQEMGVSQMPVREALRRLVADGLAVRHPYRGVQVVQFSPEDIVDICAVRMVVESLAVRYATPSIALDLLEQLTGNLHEAAACTHPNTWDRRRRLNTLFHLTICRASGHRYLVHQVEALWDWFPSIILYEGMRRQQEQAEGRLARENREHWAILDALKRRDARQAEYETRCHIQNALAELGEVLGIAADLGQSPQVV